jgi:hypothetical protein
MFHCMGGIWAIEGLPRPIRGKRPTNFAFRAAVLRMQAAVFFERVASGRYERVASGHSAIDTAPPAQFVHP